jgi:hypothetical protein
MLISLTALFIFLVIIIMIIVTSRRMRNGYDSFDDTVEDEVVHTTTTTTTTTHDTPAPVQGWTQASGASDFGRNTAGTITRGWQDNKPYVIDPVDGTTMQLAETDDLYEDAAGKMWNLI